MKERERKRVCVCVRVGFVSIEFEFEIMRYSLSLPLSLSPSPFSHPSLSLTPCSTLQQLSPYELDRLRGKRILSLGCGAAFSLALVDPTEDKEEEIQAGFTLEDALRQGNLEGQPSSMSSRPYALMSDDHRPDRLSDEVISLLCGHFSFLR
jgi:hypothetical protein